MRLKMTLLHSFWSRIDRFLAAILLTVAVAAMMPARGETAAAVGWLADAAIVLLFFMHGAKLSPQEALVGARHWRLHVTVFLSTFALFPLLGISARFLAPGFLPGPLWAGVILLTALPLDGAGLDRFHVGGGRQRAGGDVQRDRIEPARRFPDAADRRFPARQPRPRH